MANVKSVDAKGAKNGKDEGGRMKDEGMAGRGPATSPKPSWLLRLV
jgi:hypothetical protein